MNIDLVLKKPVITEKSLAEISFNKYTFEVDKKASKNQIKEAVEKLFKVSVLDVAIVNLKGKIRRYGKLRKKTQLSGYKKAVVRLKKGDKIPLFEEIKGEIEKS